MKFTFFEVKENEQDISFDYIYEYIKKENGGTFIDSFSDNIETYLTEIYGIQFDYDIDFINDVNTDAVDEVFQKWQDYLEEKMKSENK